MFKRNVIQKTSIKQNTSYIGESIEKKIERILHNGEPITDGAPIVYTERKDGVRPEFNVRTDRFDVAIDAMDKVSKTHKAKREDRLKAVKGGKDDNKNDGGETEGQSLQGTDNK